MEKDWVVFLLLITSLIGWILFNKSLTNLQKNSTQRLGMLYGMKICISLFLFCIGYETGLLSKLIIEKVSLSNFSIVCISILAIGGTIFNFVVEQGSKSKLSIPSYLKLYIWKTDALTYEICFGIPLALLMIIFDFTAQFTIGIIFVLFFCIISFLYILFYNYIFLQSKNITKTIWDVVSFDITTDKRVYYDYNESCFFTNCLKGLLTSTNNIQSTDKEFFKGFVELVSIHATPVYDKIGSKSTNFDRDLLTYYLHDFIDIYRYGLKTLRPKDEDDWRIYQLRDFVRQMILNCKKYNDYYLMIWVYGYIIGVSMRDYGLVIPILDTSKPSSKIDHVMKLFIPDNLFYDNISNHKNNAFIDVTYLLAIISCIMSTINMYFCNDIYNEFDDKTTEIETTIEYFKYVSRLLAEYYKHFLSKYICIPVYIIASFVLLLNSLQFRTWEVKPPPQIESCVSSLVKNSLIKLIIYNKKDFLNNVDDSLSDFYYENNVPLLFKSIYSWRDLISDEKVYFEFIVGFIVIIDLKNDTYTEKELMFNSLTSTTFKHIDNSQECINNAIHKTINTWNYSEDMKEILRNYLDKFKEQKVE